MSFQNQVLGTIISSVLSYDALCKAMNNESAAIDNKRSSYVPCDGRSIIGSLLETSTNLPGHTHITNAPDLRGKFIRGLNVIYNVDQPLPFDPVQVGDPDGANRQAGNYQADDFAKHNHQWMSGQGFASGGSDVYARNEAGFNIANNTTNSGGSETRPRNVAVHFYIRIN